MSRKNVMNILKIHFESPTKFNRKKIKIKEIH